MPKSPFNSRFQRLIRRNFRRVSQSVLCFADIESSIQANPLQPTSSDYLLIISSDPGTENIRRHYLWLFIPKREYQIDPLKDECKSHNNRSRDDLGILNFLDETSVGPHLSTEGPVGHWVVIRDKESFSVDFWCVGVGDTSKEGVHS